MATFTLLDAEATTAINSLIGTYPWLDHLMVLITTIGVPLLVGAVVLSWWIGSGGRHAAEQRQLNRHAAVVCGLSFLIGLGLNQLILLLVHRIRPYDAGVTHLLIAPSTDPSFPSDHATAAFSIVSSYLLLARFRRAFLFGIGAMLVMLSRVYIGTHYVSDIGGGMLTALIAALLVTALYKPETRLNRMITGLL